MDTVPYCLRQGIRAEVVRNKIIIAIITRQKGLPRGQLVNVNVLRMD